MVKRNVRKAGKAGKVNGSVNREAEELLLMGSALSEQMLHLLSQVATTPKGIGAATSALAMAWATLKDVATCECIEVESLFESEVAFFEGALVEE
jgi:hypothetical protein